MCAFPPQPPWVYGAGTEGGSWGLWTCGNDISIHLSTSRSWVPALGWHRSLERRAKTLHSLPLTSQGRSALSCAEAALLLVCNLWYIKERENPAKPVCQAGSIGDLDPGGMAGGNWDSISFTPGVLPFPAPAVRAKGKLQSPLPHSRLEILGRTFLLQWEVCWGRGTITQWDNTVSAPHPMD